MDTNGTFTIATDAKAFSSWLAQQIREIGDLPLSLEPGVLKSPALRVTYPPFSSAPSPEQNNRIALEVYAIRETLLVHGDVKANVSSSGPTIMLFWVQEKRLEDGSTALAVQSGTQYDARPWHDKIVRAMNEKWPQTGLTQITSASASEPEIVYEHARSGPPYRVANAWVIRRVLLEGCQLDNVYHEWQKRIREEDKQNGRPEKQHSRDELRRTIKRFKDKYGPNITVAQADRILGPDPDLHENWEGNNQI